MKSSEERYRNLLPRFETKKRVRQRRSETIRILENRDHRARRIARKLIKCSGEEHCKLPICSVCVRELRKSFVLGALACVDELQSGAKSGLKFPITAFSAIPIGDQYPIGQLHTLDLTRTNKRIQ